MPIPIAEVQKMAAMCGNALHADPYDLAARERLELLNEILRLHSVIAGDAPPDPIEVAAAERDEMLQKENGA